MTTQPRLEKYLDPFGSFVLPRYFEGRPVHEQLKIRALILASEMETFTADDLRGYCPPGTNRKVLGSVLGALKRQGYIEAVGHTRSGVPTNHGRVIWIYRITNEGRRYLESLLEGTD